MSTFEYFVQFLNKIFSTIAAAVAVAAVAVAAVAVAAVAAAVERFEQNIMFTF